MKKISLLILLLTIGSMITQAQSKNKSIVLNSNLAWAAIPNGNSTFSAPAVNNEVPVTPYTIKGYEYDIEPGYSILAGNKTDAGWMQGDVNTSNEQASANAADYVCPKRCPRGDLFCVIVCHKHRKNSQSTLDDETSSIDVYPNIVPIQ